MPGITPAKIRAIIAHIMLLVALSVAMSPALTALYIFQTLMNTINDITAKTNRTTAYTIKMPAKKPIPYPKVNDENVAKVIIYETAPSAKAIIAIIENIQAIRMYVLIDANLSVMGVVVDNLTFFFENSFNILSTVGVNNTFSLGKTLILRKKIKI
jgi:hypothetical protein